MRYVYALINLFIITFLLHSCVYASPITAQGTVEVFFSPQGGATDAIVKVLGVARKEILIQAYTITDSNIINALVQAKKRGVKVEVILDFEHAEVDGSIFTFDNNGIPVFVDAEHLRNHDKVMIVDRTTVITGSFDFTREAETANIENLLVIKGNLALAEKYLGNYSEHFRHSRPYIRSSVK
jgi:phosphatidylserine/phosphatidylglycerophosphate/cardiolipin synthase-like enzyme